jgi:hypothetical protein
VRLVVVGNILVIVPLVTPLLLKPLVLLTLVFNPTMCICDADDVTQISVIPPSPLAVFFQWSETASRVPVRALPVVLLMTPCFTITVECRVNYGCCVEHHVDVLHMCINFFVVLR